MNSKKTITITCDGKDYKVSWFPGSDDSSIEKAIRSAISYTDKEPLLLLDDDNASVAINDQLPDGIKLTCAKKATSELIKPPGPKPWPVIGNMLDVLDRKGSHNAVEKLIKEYGPFVFVKLPRSRMFFCSDAEILQDVLKQKDNFQKVIPPPNMGLGNLRAYTTGDGLFTSSDTEEIWQIAHRILLPGFGVPAIKQYYERMLEVADELISHLDKTSANESILVTDWMTRMTFEAISYAGFATRFHSMEQKDLPPFVHAMVESLVDAMHAPQRIFPDWFYVKEKKKREAADALMRKTVDDIIADRKRKIEKGENVPNDLLQIMLVNSDKVTGKKLPEENIRNQLITFLIAGHETTSGLLSYAIYRLMTNPEAEKKLMDEVDQVLGRDYSYKPTYEDLEKLKYTLRVLKEALRLDPTAPGFSKTCVNDTVLANKYEVKKSDRFFFNLHALHRNQKYWGEDPERFDPDRFLPEVEAKRHPDAYHPFGAGIRSCIGFQFALKEATMVLARLYQRYKFHLKDKNYSLEHVQTLTVKPKDLYVFIEKRAEEKGKLPIASPTKELKAPPQMEVQKNAPPLLFLFGSNMGTCQNIAQQLALHAQAKGYKPIVRELDEQVEKPWESSCVAIITSTYNGTPPDNAQKFANWIQNQTGTPFSTINYTVLGVGNSDWHQTFQQFPKFVNEKMKELGAKPFFPIGAADVGGDYDKVIEDWAKGALVELKKILPSADTDFTEDKLLTLTYSSEITNFSGSAAQKIPSTPLDQQVKRMQVLQNRELLTNSDRSTKHIEIKLPDSLTYKAGDHLGVLPENPQDAVEKACQICKVRPSDMVILKSLQDIPQTEKLPIGIPIAVKDLFTNYVDLLGQVTRKELRMLAKYCPCPPEKKALEELSQDKFADEVFGKERTFLDICDQFRSVDCSLDLLLSCRPALKARYYSISSSPLVMPDKSSLTVGVQEHTTKAGRLCKGVCSNFLAKLTPNSSLNCFVKDTMSHFRLPADPTQDIILIGPGTGLAPLRGFLQERNEERKRGTKIGRQILFFGCRNPDQDYIYRQELEEYEKTGLLNGLFVAFSRLPGKPKCYVQDLIKANAKLVFEYVQNNARILVCGDGKHMAPEVRKTLKEIYETEGKLTKEAAEKLFQEKQKAYFYVEDVWAG